MNATKFFRPNATRSALVRNIGISMPTTPEKKCISKHCNFLEGFYENKM